MDLKLRPLAYRPNRPISPLFPVFEEKTTETALPLSLEILSAAYQGRTLPGLLRLSNLDFTRNDFAFLI